MLWLEGPSTDGRLASQQQSFAVNGSHADRIYGAPP